MKRLGAPYLLAAAWLLAGCGGSSVAPAEPILPSPGIRTAFVGVRVVTMEAKTASGATLDDQTVIVQGERIETIGPSSRVRIPEGAVTIDGRGNVLLPGLVDMHVHLSHAQHLPLYLARGVTTVRNMWGAPMHVDWRREIEEGRRLGPTIRTAGPIVDGKDPVHGGSFVALTPDDADRAVALHVAAGYDFVKAYTKLEPAVFARLVERAKAANLAVVGHVPREVGLLRAIDSGVSTIEHTNTYYDALQADDSPVKGKTDRASRQQWVDHLDEAKLASIAERFVANRAWACPTRVVMRSAEPKESQLAQLARPEVKKYTLPSDLAIWTPGREVAEAEQKRNARELQVADAIVRELHRRGAGIIAGTDVGNPLVVPGYALHDELGELVRIGLTPYEALGAATRDAAAVLGMSADIGTIAVGKRADLLLVAGDPLRVIRDTTRIEGVMRRGEWFGAAAVGRMLAGAEAWARGHDDPFAKHARLGEAGAEDVYSATYRVSWKDTPFDTERVLVQRAANGRLSVYAEAFDPHEGEWTRMALHVTGDHVEISLGGEGAIGRGQVKITRPAPALLHAEGTALSGDPILVDVPIDPDAVLVVDRFLGGLALLPMRVRRDVKVVSLSLRSTVEAQSSTWALHPEAGSDRLEIRTEKGAPRFIEQDASGNPIKLTMQAHGAKLEWTRKP